LCYSPAYLLGAANGLLLAMALRPSKIVIWRRNNVK
jgi:hypothetical protein